MSTSNFDISNHTAVRQAAMLADEMLRIAEKSFRNCEDDGCMRVFGIIRDCGYKIRKTVEREEHALLQRRSGRPIVH